MDNPERLIWSGLVFVDADVILHRGVHRRDRQHFLWPIVGWRVDVPWRQGPEPVRMLFFEVFSDLAIIVYASAYCGSVSPERVGENVSGEWVRTRRFRFVVVR